ncbi:hypothetical protein EJB05_19378 [Eragrostis curvula]|uniref:Secreted protein n=1 Tax=Eragrostis curvula TaxID=38414 RepID=A0A5J9UXR3_9POAL|nr:hypothetical protein EJB05_19378 [Eragrostis curvula]
MNRITPLLITAVLMLVLLVASCALSSTASRPPPGPVWTRDGQDELRLHMRPDTIGARRRRLGQRLPGKPPSPNPNGMTTMVKPGPPPAAY